MHQPPYLTALLSALAILLLGAAPGRAQEPARKPNILFLLADDLGIADVGCYGADHAKTPNIDALAKGGTRFTRAYTAPLCGPSRALILTGRYAFRTGAVNQDQTGDMSPERETFLPKILKPAGYVTACIGKWGQLPLGPAQFGFDESLRFQGSGVYWSSQKKNTSYEVNGQKRSLRDGEYMPDLMHAQLVEFLTKHRTDPFYVYYSMSHVHSDILPTPDSAKDSKTLYEDNLAYMDKLVGKALAELDRLQLRENTLVVFFGDNGTAKARSNRATIGGRRLSGEKGCMLEGGGLVPLIVHWPGKVPTDRICADLFDASDFVPTFAEVAGATLPTATKLDGQSQLASWRGTGGKRRDWVFQQLADQFYVRSSGWKLNEKGELFDMREAPFAEPMVAADRMDGAAQAARAVLQAALDQLRPQDGVRDHGDGTGRHANRNSDAKKDK